jgi:hypothetical protein
LSDDINAITQKLPAPPRSQPKVSQDPKDGIQIEHPILKSFLTTVDVRYFDLRNLSYVIPARYNKNTMRLK